MASDDTMQKLFEPHVQEALFKKAFDYVKSKHGEVNTQTCISEMYNKDLDEEYVICVCWACLSLIEMSSETFEEIEEGLTSKMKKSIMKQVGEQLSR